MAVNTVDKLQFLSFIFAVLLSITIQYSSRLGRAIVHQYAKIILKSVQMFMGYHGFSFFCMAIKHLIEFLKGKILF